MEENAYDDKHLFKPMTDDYDLAEEAFKLAPKVKPTIGASPLRSITWEYDQKMGAYGVHAIYKRHSGILIAYLTWCDTEQTAERLANELRTIVYARERLAGRMKGRDDE